MISQYEVPGLIQDEFPQLTSQLHTSKTALDVYKSVQCFAGFTKEAVKEHNFSLSKKCFKLAEKLYNNGDLILKSVIENNFIYTFSSYMSGSKSDITLIKSIIPAAFYAIYLKQVMQSGC